MFSFSYGEDVGDPPLKGDVREIRWGTYWEGSRIDRASRLKGKVTLLLIWGG